MIRVGSRFPLCYFKGGKRKVWREQPLSVPNDLAFGLWGKVMFKGLLEK